MDQEVIEKVENRLKAAGVLYITAGRILLVQRGPDGDEPGTWGLPAGGIELAETPMQAAIRENVEEVGHTPENELRELAVTNKDGVEFTTFLCLGDDFTPVINSESTAWQWVEFGQLDRLPSPVHPGLVALLHTPQVQQIWKNQLNELQLAQAMRDGYLPSPQKIGSLNLWKMRITGTGLSYRDKDEQYVYRPPEHYLTPDFLQRCNGLMVIWTHTEEDELRAEELHEKVIGSVMLGYIDETEVLGVVRVYDEHANVALLKGELSTSPNVIFRKGEGSVIRMADGTEALIEGLPGLVDHLAVCGVGVWDKGGASSGVINETSLGVMEMAEAKKDGAESPAEEAKKDSITNGEPEWFKAFRDSMEARMDAMEGKKDAKKDNAEEPKKDNVAEPEKEAKKDSGKKDEENMPTNTAEPAADSKKDSAARGMTDEEKARLSAIENVIKPLTDADYNALADAQIKADSVMQSFGKPASRPFQGETPMAYRRRLAAGMKSHSPTWNTINLADLNDAAFSIAEAQIYKDAQTASRAPADLPAGTLREVVRRHGGREITEFVGDISAFTRPFKAHVKNVTINKQ